ncbi:uncharacterized protein UV8b_04302 [Ustilaginoidea virens]|uniref:Uncharacterized protein n=1 Tax=Ustilaginoidea virens TaxID=1159556 RepID=A0A8E5MHV0_USTVR|nr:uncharacterized protein UV8b_04302 [Ustilaginoidea virens]QUC20061.1 hypothetical protein UV8b_04302 [Ustilaginoidea virens]
MPDARCQMQEEHRYGHVCGVDRVTTSALSVVDVWSPVQSSPVQSSPVQSNRVQQSSPSLVGVLGVVVRILVALAWLMKATRGQLPAVLGSKVEDVEDWA